MSAQPLGQSNEQLPSENRWYLAAACKGADREQFYISVRGRSNGDPLNLKERYCGHCVVVDSCLDEAIEMGDMHPTVIGGKTRPERKQLIQEKREREGEPRKKSTATYDPERVSRVLAEFFVNRPK
jgi:hypothetical protein